MCTGAVSTARAKYGGVLVKKPERGSELRLTGMAWRDMITDQVEVRSGSGADLICPARLGQLRASSRHDRSSADAVPHDDRQDPFKSVLPLMHDFVSAAVLSPPIALVAHASRQ